MKLQFMHRTFEDFIGILATAMTPELCFKSPSKYTESF